MSSNYPAWWDKYADRLYDSVLNGGLLNEGWTILKEMHDDGVPQKEAYELLADMRWLPEIQKHEPFEDRILELMDFVWGFCSPQASIWETTMSDSQDPLP